MKNDLSSTDDVSIDDEVVIAPLSPPRRYDGRRSMRRAPRLDAPERCQASHSADKFQRHLLSMQNESLLLISTSLYRAESNDAERTALINILAESDHVIMQLTAQVRALQLERYHMSRTMHCPIVATNCVEPKRHTPAVVYHYGRVKRGSVPSMRFFLKHRKRMEPHRFTFTNALSIEGLQPYDLKTIAPL